LSADGSTRSRPGRSDHLEGADRPVTQAPEPLRLVGQSLVSAPKEVSMQRALALFALSLFVSLTLTAVALLITRPEARSALFEAANRWRPDEPEEVSA